MEVNTISKCGPPPIYDFAVLTSLTHPGKMLWVVLQTGKQEIEKKNNKDLSARSDHLIIHHLTTPLQFITPYCLKFSIFLFCPFS
jgi:hypothetical protein